jgi:hypothetical protein
MNSIFNSLKLQHWLMAASLAVLALANTGCTDHGPVGIYSQELFNKFVSSPHLDFSSASGVTFTVNNCCLGYSSSSTVPPSTPFSAFVYLDNDGGSSTYGPIIVYFSCKPTPYLHLVSEYNQVIGLAADGTGQEVPANGTTLVLERGYDVTGTAEVIDVTDSLQFWSSVPYGSGANFTPVIIDMRITDALGEKWDNQFTVYIQT